MRLFLIKFSIFSLSFVFTLGMFVVLSSLIVKQNTSVILSPDINKIIIGHSYSETAFDDSMITGIKNCSESGESYFYNYQKLKIILNYNEQVDTVFVNFSNNQVFSDMNDWIWGEKYMNYNLTKYQPWCEKEDILLCAKNNFFIFSQTQAVVIKNNLKKIIKNNYSDPLLVGGYKAMTQKITKEEKQGEINDNTYKISGTNLNYLKKMIELCNQKRIKVILLRPPVKEINLNQPVEVEFQKIRKNYFANIEFWDFINLPMDKKLHFFDNTHVNKEGSRIVTLELNEKMTK
jgi:hypothetical protein